MLWNMIKELQKGFVVTVVEFCTTKTTVKDQGDMSIIWKVSAQVALQAANSCCLLKKKEVGSHREHLVAGVNTRKHTGNDK